MADIKTDKEIAENLFLASKKVVKHLAEDFQLADHDFEMLVDQTLERNMPDRPNPLMSWQDVENPSVDLTVDKLTKKATSLTQNSGI